MADAALLKDYSVVPPELAKLCREMQEKIDQGEHLLVDLLDDNIREDERLRIFERGKDGGTSIMTGKYVGLFEYQGKRVVIGSRFDGGGQAFFLRCLLENCWDASLLLMDGLGCGYQDDSFDLLLVAKLAVQLQRAWRKGPLRAYRAFRHNDSRVCGPLDVPRHIRENLGLDNGKIAYNTRSYSQNNDCNTLFLLACAAAERKHPELLCRLRQRLPEFRDAIRALERDIPDWQSARRSAVLQRTGKKLVNPLYRDYEPARVTARAILRRMGADPFQHTGEERQVTGVFLDITRLWENFLAGALFPETAEECCQQTRGFMNGRMMLRPDFLWEKKGVVLDAKYRGVWAKTLGLEGKWSDTLKRWDQKAVEENVYQVLAYMLTQGCREGGVIFPVSDSRGYRRYDPDSRKYLKYNPVPATVGPAGELFWRVPFYIPEARDYGDFLARMEDEAKRLRDLKPIRMIL